MKKILLVVTVMMAVVLNLGCGVGKQAINTSTNGIKSSSYGLVPTNSAVEIINAQTEQKYANAQLEKIKAETALLQAAETNPEKYAPALAANNVAVNGSGEGRYKIYIYNETPVNLDAGVEGSRPKLIPAGKPKLGAEFSVDSRHFQLSTYTPQGSLFKEGLYKINHRGLRGTAPNGKAYDIIIAVTP